MTTTKKNTTFALSIFVIGVFMSALDNGIISSALSTINYSFHVSEVAGSWGITLYTLGMAISTPIIGKLADNYGRKKLFLIEIALFAFGSLLVALSPNFTFFLAARLLQSFGGGGIFIIASSHILSTYPKKQQGKLLGILGSVNGIASIVGPNLGSLILNLTGKWHMLFMINLPIAVFVLIAGIISIPETTNSNDKQVDLKGLSYLTLAILSFMLAVTNIQSGSLLQSLTSIGFILPLILSIIFIGLLLNAEKNVKDHVDPFLPYNLLNNKRFLLTLLMGALSGMLIAIFVFIPSFVEQAYGISANNSGIYMSGIGLGSIFGAGIGGALVTKMGAPKSIVISGALSTLGFGLIAVASPNPLTFILASTVAGLGFGMLMGAPLSVLMSLIAGPKDSGVALGTLSVSRQIGLTIAPTIYAALVQQQMFSSSLAQASPAKSIEQLYIKLQQIGDSSLRQHVLELFHQSAKAAYQHLFFAAVIFSAIILICGAYLKKRPH